MQVFELKRTPGTRNKGGKRLRCRGHPIPGSRPFDLLCELVYQLCSRGRRGCAQRPEPAERQNKLRFLVGM